MHGRIICASVSHISLTDDDLVILLVAAQRLIRSGHLCTFAKSPDEGVYVTVSVSQKYLHFMGLRSRQFDAVVKRGEVAGLVTYFVDEEYLRSVPLPRLLVDHARESARHSGLRVIQPQSPTDN